MTLRYIIHLPNTPIQPIHLKRISTDSFFPASSGKHLPTSSLLACSSIYSYTCLASDTGLGIYKTADISSAIEAKADIFVGEIKLASPALVIKLSGSEKRVFVVTCDTVHVYDVLSILSTSHREPSYSIKESNDPICDIFPNPAIDNESCVASTKSGRLLSLLNGSTTPIPVDFQTTTACWSKKGKQLACGTTTGQIVRILLDGTVKNTIAAPNGVSSSVNHVIWVETKVFIAVYDGGTTLSYLITQAAV